MVPVTGEPFVWVLALPVLGVFFLADAVWGVMQRKSWTDKPCACGPSFGLCRKTNVRPLNCTFRRPCLWMRSNAS